MSNYTEVDENELERRVCETLEEQFNEGDDAGWLADQIADQCNALAPILRDLFADKGDGVDARLRFERFMERVRADFVDFTKADSPELYDEARQQMREERDDAACDRAEEERFAA